VIGVWMRNNVGKVYVKSQVGIRRSIMNVCPTHDYIEANSHGQGITNSIPHIAHLTIVLSFHPVTETSAAKV
jgi:hypothetical protein